MKFSPSLLLGATALSLSLAGPAAVAQSSSAEQATDQPLVQDEIVVVGEVLYANQVNALRSPTPIIDVPQSLSIITADEIAQQGFDSIGDIISYTPGVNSSQGEGHRDAVVFRGVRSTADFYIDGVRDDVQYYRPLYNLEQVEILRGPNALLFGRGGTGGILNRVTKKGVIGETFTGYRLGVDTFGAFSGEVDYNVSTSDASAFRINGLYESLQNHRDFYDGERLGLNPTLRANIGSSTILDLSYEYIDHERYIDRGIPTGADGTPVEAFENIVFGDPGLNTTELEAHVFRAGLQHQFSETLKGNINAFYGDYDKLYANFYASGYDQLNSPNLVTLDGYIDTTQRESFILSGNLVGEFATGGISHTVIAGAELIDTQNNNDRFNAFWSTTQDDNEQFLIQRPLDLNRGIGVNADGQITVNDYTTDLNDDTEAEVNTVSLYLQDEIELSRYLDIVLGARFDRFEIEALDETTGETRTRTDEEISPRFGIILKPRENVSVYASYSESFLPRSGEQFATLSDTTRALDPDEFESAEVGLKWDFVPGLSFTAAYFQNEQISAERDDVTGEGFEVRGLEVEGFELQLQGQITEKFFVSTGYSYLDGETDNGAEIPRELPENMLSFWGAYQVTEKLGVGLGATYQDESFITDFDVGTVGSHPTLPAYTRVDAAMYYDVSDTLRVQLNVENLTDELYFPTAHSTHQATVGAPLNARLSISGRF